ncbi:MAG: DNA-binding protein [Lachnospiraceae bacterium]|nr:DNA-binding protein [Lachnospiraceae bacterium]
MERIVEQNLLYDFYGDLLTDHQKRIYERAVFEDLSLKELSEEYGITRQGVHDLIKRCDKILNEYENKLHMVERFTRIKAFVKDIDSKAETMEGSMAEDIHKLCREIMESL